MRWLAFVVAVALGSGTIAPARATSTSPYPGLDTRVAELLRSHPCGEVSRALPPPEPSLDLARVLAIPRAPALPSRDDARVHLELRMRESLAQATMPPTPTPEQSPDAAPSATASASPSPSATPSLVPIPPVPPIGPQSIIAPTPRPTGSATASPVPLPTTSPLATDTGPVFIQRTGTPAPITGKGESPAPTASPNPNAATPSASAEPKPLRTLAPNEIVTVADKLEGSSDRTKPSDLYGNVHIFYAEGQIVGDRAHFDGDHTIVVSGHTYLVNRSEDSILYADSASFDTVSRRATLLNGSGETIEGVQRGKLHYTAESLIARTNGVSHGERASFSTCERPHAGYHIEARSIDVTPGSKIVARKAVVFLGPTAIFYLPLLVIPLVEAAVDQRKNASFLPLIGYNKTEGFFVKARIGFAPSDTYFGYYRLEYFTKRGLGLGYTAFIGSSIGKRSTSIDSYSIDDHLQKARHTNISVQETENFNRRVRGQFGIDYVSDYGPNLALPATVDLRGSLIRQGNGSTETLTFSRFLRGKLSDNFNVGFIDSLVLSPSLQQQINLTYAKFNSSISSSNTLKISTNTHLFTKFADYNLAYDKSDYSANPFGYDRLPELQVLPHFNYGTLKFGPQVQFTIGKYTEPQNHFTTSRVQAKIDESVFFKIFGNSDFSAHYNIDQDYYGTGDAKAFDQQNASLNTPIGTHFVNSISYNEQHPIGPANVPFQLFDRLSNGAHSAQDTLRFFNRDIYSFQLATGTSFNRQAQSVSYQASVKPSPRSYVVLGGYYQPGSGRGFNQTNVQAITPFGKETTLEFTTNVDWKNHNRLTNKNIYITRTIDDCYNISGSYNQDLKQFSFNVVILAFPGQGAGFGIGGQKSPIIPGSFAF